MTKNISLISLAALLGALIPGSAGAFGSPANLIAAKSSAANYPKNFSGNVSWYGVPFHGKLTASGKVFDMNKCTSAHLKLPFYTKVMVEDPKSGKSVIVTVLDRGPYVKTRVMDLAREAAKELGTLGKGISYVDCTVIDDSEDEGGKATSSKEPPVKEATAKEATGKEASVKETTGKEAQAKSPASKSPASKSPASNNPASNK